MIIPFPIQNPVGPATALDILPDRPHVVRQPRHPQLDVLGQDGHVGRDGVQRADREVRRLREALVAPREGLGRVQGLNVLMRSGISCLGA